VLNISELAHGVSTFYVTQNILHTLNGNLFATTHLTTAISTSIFKVGTDHPRFASTMAAQSKLLPPDRTVKSIVKQLTTLYLKHRTNISRTVYLTLFVALINRIRNAINEQKAASARQLAARRTGATVAGDGEATKKKKVELNREFFKSLFRLLKIVVPGWKSTEMRLLISHSIFLVIRTLISLHVAELDGKLVSSLVRGRGREFLIGIVWWMIVAVPATFTNSMVCRLHMPHRMNHS
jgi:ATP-binding cassette subfamily D (ALD) long-chain fatty acid import protein